MRMLEDHLKVLLRSSAICNSFSCDSLIVEISEGSGGEIKQITRAYKRLVKIRQENTTTTEQSDPVSTAKQARKAAKSRNGHNGTSAAEMLPRIVKKLELGWEVEKNAGNLAKRAAQLLEGKHPNTIAAASLLYYLKQHKDSQGSSVYDKQVAQAAGVAPSTMRSAFRVLEENKLALTVD